ncbi:MAG: hypothetical protein AMJ45_06475 [Syntrophobacter sp. DG_60]|nr:MAG: hypothetical protein AMJ45_06475 [Syntrophobacter sp. DG_60]
MLLKRIRTSEFTLGMTTSIIVGAIAGLGAVIFRWMIRGFQWLFFKQGGEILMPALSDYYVILLPAIGGLIVGLLIYLFAKEAKGHGVPEVMEAVVLRGGKIRPRVSIIKSLASSICIGSGGSVGREGPIVQIGSSMASAVAQWFKLPGEWTKNLVLCGTAGAISATFNAPVGGVFFALEVMARRAFTRGFIFVLIASLTANLVASPFLGTKPSFTVPLYEMKSYWEVIFYIGLGIASGLTAVAFIKLLYSCEDLFSLFRFPEYLKPVTGGLLLGTLGYFFNDIFGIGYGGSYLPGGEFVTQGALDKALMGKIAIFGCLSLVFLKIIATSITIGSGGSGGVFAPSLFIGGMLGGFYGAFFHHFFPDIIAYSGAYALVGMGAVFAGTGSAPLTSIVMLIEMTRDYTLTLPVITATTLSFLLSRALLKEDIYTTKLIRRGIDVDLRVEEEVLKKIRVEEVMTKDFPTISASMTVRQLFNIFTKTGYHGFPVTRDGKLCGIITLNDIRPITRRKGWQKLKVIDVATKNLIVAYSEQTLDKVIIHMGEKQIGRVPVVDKNDKEKLLGVLTREDILRAYTKSVMQRI